MLVRWAAREERKRFGYPETRYGEHDVLVAVDRRSGAAIAAMGLSRTEGRIEAARQLAEERDQEAIARLAVCAERQLHPKGGSFHYCFPRYAKEAEAEHCPACLNLSMPEGLVDIAELSCAVATAERRAQGGLFGKCHVMAKRHTVHLEEMPPDEMTGFMCDVQRVGRALRNVTGAVRINYEVHANTAPHLHCHLFPRYLDDDFPSAPIDYRVTEPSPYRDEAEFDWFVERMREELSRGDG